MFVVESSISEWVKYVAVIAQVYTYSRERSLSVC